MRPFTKYSFGRGQLGDIESGTKKEWLLTNGIGGYANGTICGNNNRVFSAYLIASKCAPVERMLILAKTQEEILCDGRVYDLAAQEYPGQEKSGYRYLSEFSLSVYPQYVYQVQGITIRKRIALAYGENCVAIVYEIKNSTKPATFSVTPLFNYRPYAEAIERNGLDFIVAPEQNPVDSKIVLRPKKCPTDAIVFEVSEGVLFDRAGKPTSMATPNYRIEENLYYRTDAMNGFTGVDNHYTPYEVQVDLMPGETRTVACLCRFVCGKKEDRTTAGEKCFTTGTTAGTKERGDTVLSRAAKIFDAACERAELLLEKADVTDEFMGRLVLSADHFLVHRESTGKKTVLAGYPWFSDWGRDTMIAFTGLSLATGRYGEAREILESFACYVRYGMIPNVFPGNAGEEPMYNTIDASLWYFYATHKYLQYTGDVSFVTESMYPVLCMIYESYRDGRALYGIHMEEDGMIAGGSDLDQLTWMDVRVGDIVVTPRHGKAVEINALWYNALRILANLAGLCKDDARKNECERLAQWVKEHFAEEFWNEEKQCLYDVIDEHHTADASIRPNQIFAVSLPYSLLTKEQEKAVVDRVFEELYTPYGLRSLSPEDAGFQPMYIGRLLDRDMAYHMGTAWGYLAGAFLEAYAKVYGDEAIEEVKQMCLLFADHMADGCLGSIAEIFDGACPTVGRGCYAQAWSVAEVLRVYREIVMP